MDETVVFRTKRRASWVNAPGFLFFLAFAAVKVVFCPGYHPVCKREAVQKALQYYVLLHDIPVNHKRLLLP